MKRFFFPILILSVLLLAAGCKKNLRDYRNKYCGKWVITAEGTSYNYSNPTGQAEISNSTIVYENARVTYSKLEDGVIQIELDRHNPNPIVIKRKLKENGVFDDCLTWGAFTNKDNLYFEMQDQGICGSYSAGGTTIRTYTGKRK